MTREQKYRHVVKVLRQQGWSLVRTKGSHEVWESPDGKRFVVPHHRTVSAGVLQKLVKLLPKDSHNWR